MMLNFSLFINKRGFIYSHKFSDYFHVYKYNNLELYLGNPHNGTKFYYIINKDFSSICDLNLFNKYYRSEKIKKILN